VINRAFAAYNDRENWPGLVKRAMEWDFSWEASAKEYIKMYYTLLDSQTTTVIILQIQLILMLGNASQ
jgi:starch synthase